MISQKPIQYKFSEKITEFTYWLLNQGYQVRDSDAFRSTDLLACPDCGHQHSYQELLFKNGKSKVKQSFHNERRARDIIIEREEQSIPDSEWLEIGAKWEEMGGTWGGRFGVDPKDSGKIGWDRGHFEL